MSEPLQTRDVLKQALALSPIERAKLVDEVLRSFESPQRQEIEQAWAEESERRLAEYRQGRMAAIPADEVFAEIERLDSVR